jgi:Zn-dependent peptidase ImmA (M78 family)
MADYTDEDWEEIACKWRQAAGMADAVRLDAPEFVRWVKRAGYVKDYVCVPDQQLPTCEGKYDPDQEILFYRRSIWIAGERRDPHATWTLVHEGCHAILGHKEVRLRADASSKNLPSRRTRPDEIAANRLSASILAPFEKAEFKPGMSVDDIRQKFGLSTEAATKRLEEYGRIFRRKSGILRELPPGVTDFLLHQKRKGHRVTSIRDIEPLSPPSDKQYDGDPCPCCNEFALVREGLSRKCQNCGAKTGDD